MTHHQRDIRTLRTLIVVAVGGPCEDVPPPLGRATLAFERVRDGMRGTVRRKSVAPLHGVTPEEHFTRNFTLPHRGVVRW